MAAPAAYTHPTRQYLTGRWLDALASGAVVAGAVPLCQANDELPWPEATLEPPPEDMPSGMAPLREAVNSWTPDRARLNHAMALRRLDWRHRFAAIAENLGWSSASLQAELDRFQVRVAGVDSQPTSECPGGD
ncbi:MAG: hypothetical protein ACK5MP_09845 [Nostocoides sp.]